MNDFMEYVPIQRHFNGGMEVLWTWERILYKTVEVWKTPHYKGLK